jgi:hypothetical protein
MDKAAEKQISVGFLDLDSALSKLAKQSQMQ